MTSAAPTLEKREDETAEPVKEVDPQVDVDSDHEVLIHTDHDPPTQAPAATGLVRGEPSSPDAGPNAVVGPVEPDRDRPGTEPTVSAPRPERRKVLSADGAAIWGTDSQSEKGFTAGLKNCPPGRLPIIFERMWLLPEPTEFDRKALQLFVSAAAGLGLPAAPYERLIKISPAARTPLLQTVSLAALLDFAATEDRLDFFNLCWKRNAGPVVLGLAGRQLPVLDPVLAKDRQSLAKLLGVLSSTSGAIERLFTVDAAELIDLLTVPTPICATFCATDDRFTFLRTWHARLDPATFRQLSPEACDGYLASAERRADLGKLLGLWPVPRTMTIMAVISDQPATAPILTSELAPPLLEALLEIGSGQLAQFATDVPQPCQQAFLKTVERIAFLPAALTEAGPSRVASLAPHLDHWEFALADPTSAILLRSLLTVHGGEELTELLSACPAGAPSGAAKLTLIQDADKDHIPGASLRTCLTLCGVAEWPYDAVLPTRIRLLHQALAGLTGEHRTKPVLELLDAHRTDLLDQPTSIRNACAVIASDQSIEQAARQLSRLRMFEFDANRLPLVEHAEQAAQTHATGVIEARAADIDTKAAASRVEAITSMRDTAKDELTNNQRKGLEASEATDKGREARAKLLEKQNVLAAPKIAVIDADAAAKKRRVEQEDAPAAQQAKHSEYVSYYQAVRFHPQARPALDFALRLRTGGAEVANSTDVALATQLVTAIAGAPLAAPLLLCPTLDLAAARRLAALPGIDLTWIAGELAPADCALFARTDLRLSFLQECRTRNVPGAHLTALCGGFATWDNYFGTVNEASALAQLLATFAPATVRPLLTFLLEGQVPTAVQLAQVCPHIATAGDLTQLLTLWEQAASGWPALIQFLGVQGPGLTFATLRAPACRYVLAQFNRDNQFSHWVAAVGTLLDHNQMQITCRDAELLPHGPGTWENVLTVTAGAYLQTFVVHTHPGAAAASVGSANSSKLHIKPVRGNTQTPRVYVEQIPQKIKDAYKDKIQK